MDFGHASILISLLLGIFCVGRIRSYDVHEKEPCLKLFLVAVYGGLLAAAVSLVAYRIADALGFSGFHTWYGFFLFVGPIEEGAKYLGLRATRLFYGRRLNEATDGIIYMAAVALGFSLIENFMYANAGLGNGHLLWLRLLLATPGHILFSFPMGLTHYLSREEGHPRWTLAGSFAIACVSHGVYNNLCSGPLGIILAPLFLILLWMGLLSILRYSHTTSPFRTTLDSFLGRLPPSVRAGLLCHQCGNEGDMPYYAEGSLELRRCGDCGYFVLTRENAFRLFNRFAPEFRSIEGEYRPSIGKEGYLALYGVIHVHEKSAIGFFHGETVQDKLTEISQRMRGRLEKRAYIRFLFRPPRLHAAGQPAGFPARSGLKELPHRGDLAFAGIGMGICVFWGMSHLASLQLVSLHPAFSQTWQDSTMSLSYPKGWNLNVWTRGDGRQVSVDIEAQGHAAMAIRSQAWEIAPVDAAEQALKELLGGLGGDERARRPLESWGRYQGSGTELDMKTSKGKDLGLSVFAHSSAGRSFVALEMVEEKYREPLRPGMELVRSTLRLKPKPALPASTAGSSPAADSLVTKALRAFLEEPETPEEGDSLEPPDAGARGLPGPSRGE